MLKSARPRAVVALHGPHWRACFSSSVARSSGEGSHYEVLGVSHTATKAEIKKKFYALSKKYHPDTNRTLAEDEQQRRKTRFQRIRDAYEVLGNTAKRRDYDASLGTSSSAGFDPYGPSR